MRLRGNPPNTACGGTAVNQSARQFVKLGKMIKVTAALKSAKEDAMRRSRIMMLSAPLAVVLMAVPALAHGPHGGGACRGDLEKILCPNVTPGPGSFRECLAACPNVTPGPGAFASCLAPLCPERTPGPGGFASCLQQAAAANNVTLSEQCQAQLTKMQANIAAWKTACGAAVTNLCPDVTPGPGGSGHRAIGKCLREHQSELTANYPACAELLAQHHGFHHHHHRHPTPTPGSGSAAQ